MSGGVGGVTGAIPSPRPDSESLFVVPCSATKSRILQDGTPLPARDAYTGQAFRMARQRLERAGAKWCILSGYYGFIWPSTVIENYDVKMEPVNESTVWDECFGAITNRQYARLMTAERIVVLGSKLYANAAAVLLHRQVEAPLVGLPIGKMLQRLANGDLFSLPNDKMEQPT
jgi:hypothetical protein